MGVSQAGFQHLGIVEHDQWCCETINDNRRRRISPVANWPTVTPTDVQDIRFDQFPSNIALVSGGPPCQPFSLGGKHCGHADARNLIPDLVRAVRVIRPRAVIVENVKGLLRKSFDPYFKYTLLTLTYPTLVQRADEDWCSHMARLERHHTAGAELEYRVDFDVPQLRGLRRPPTSRTRPSSSRFERTSALNGRSLTIFPLLTVWKGSSGTNG